MGKVIKKQLQGMSLQTKFSLVLLLTIVSSVFMYEGWYQPKDAKAAPFTYHVRGLAAQSVGTNGNTTVIAEATTSYTNTSGGTNEVRAITNNTAPTGTLRNRISAGAAWTATGDERFRSYTPAYASANTIAANATAHLTLYMRTTGTSASAYAVMYEYNDTTGFVGAAKGTTNSATLNAGVSTVQEFNVTFTNPSFTVAAGNRIAVVFYATANTSDPAYLYGATSSATPSGTTYFTVDQTVVASGPGTIQLSTATQSVGEAGPSITITATRAGGTTGVVGISYATSNVNATAGSDYTSTTGTLSWAAGDAANKTFTVPILQDTLDEVNETFTVTLSTPTGGATLGATSAQTVTITDDDTVPTVQLQSATGSGSEATTPAAIIVTLSAASGNAVNINYITANGTATAGSDYTLTSGTLTIPALSTSGTINVPITNDATIETDETFTVTLSTPVNASLGTPTVHTYTIIDNDAALVSTITTCTGCHGNPPVDGTRAGATGLFAGDHVKHAGSSGYNYSCATCHYDHGTNLAHSSGFKNVTGSRLPGNAYSQGKRIAISNAPVFGSCGTTAGATAYCHSAGTGATGQAGDARALGAPAVTMTWATTAGTCSSCHTGGTATGPTYTSGTPKANSHAAHRVTNGYTCEICHYGTTTNGTTITTVANHVDKQYDLTPAPTANFTYTYASTGGKCTTSKCHGGAGINLAWGANLGTAQCTKCHGDGSTAYVNFSSAQIAPGYGATGNDLAGGTGVTVRGGTHQAHLAATTGISDKIHCGECHKVVTTVNAATHMLYTTSRPLFTGVLATAQSHVPSVTRTSGIINCNNTYCHTGSLNTGAAMTPAWNNSTYIATVMTMTDCKKCHNMPPNPGVAGVHSAIPTALTAFPVGATCNCHTNLTTNGTTYANIFTDKLKHINGITEGGHAFPYPGATHDSAANPITSCTGCHTNVSGTYPVVRPAKPDCRSCHVKASPGTGCNSCHGRSTNGGVAGNYSSARPNGGIAGGFPNYSGSHTKHVINAGLACTGCHNGYGTGSVKHGFSNTSGATYSRTNFKKMAFTVGGTPTYTRATMTCSTLSCHGTAIWGGRLGCVDCHATAINSPNAQALDATVTQRGAVVGEFTNTWSHKRSFTGTPKVVNADCIVCHMEGVKNGGTSAVHGNGYINLRDPDTGLNIKNVTFGGTGAGSYTEGATDVSFVRFKRDFSKRLELDPSFLTIAAVQQNHCLKCHDTVGAGNVNAQVPTTGTALKPFGVTITGHSAPFNSNLSGNVVDVNKSFLTSNSSYHPVRGKQNNWFAKYSGATTTANMISPWKGPFATRGGTVNATAWGNLISCWDCHAPAGTISTSGVVTRSVTAHGAPATLRAPIRVAGTTATTNLCLACHKVGYSATTQHGANTAFTVGKSNMNAATFSNCSFCHAYSAAGATQGTASGSTSTLRPLRGEDAHGFNDRTAGTVNSRWATSNTRPFGFIRNSLNPLIYLSVTASGDTIAAGTAGTCTGTAGTCGNDMGNDPYGGGTY